MTTERRRGQVEHILELPDHIKALPDEEQGPALVKAMHELIDWDPAADNTPKGFA